MSRGYTWLRCAGFSLRWLLLLRSMGSRRAGFSSCGTQASVVVARGLSSCGLVAPWSVRSSRTSARTCIPCIGRRILNHCTTREFLPGGFEAQVGCAHPHVRRARQDRARWQHQKSQPQSRVWHLLSGCCGCPRFPES